MLYLWKWWIVVSMLIVAIIWIVAPDNLNKPIKDAEAVTNKVAEWSAERERTEAFKVWMEKLQLPTDCRYPATNLRALECENMRNLHARGFERHWRNRSQ